MIIYMTGKPFIGLSTVMQLILAMTAAVIVYGINTVLISIGMHLDTKQPVFPILEGALQLAFSDLYWHGRCRNYLCLWVQA